MRIDHKNRKRLPAIGNTRNIKKVCKYCNKIFKTKGRRKVFCSKSCRITFYKIYRKNAIYKKNDVITDMRYHFNRLKEINPVKAQKIYDEMELLEGSTFRELALNGLSPFKKS